MTWKDRRDKSLNKLAASEAKLKKTLIRILRQELAALDKDIAAYYQHYGTPTAPPSYADMMRIMDESDRAALEYNWAAFKARFPDAVSAGLTGDEVTRLDGLVSSARFHAYNWAGLAIDRIGPHLRQTAAIGAQDAVECMAQTFSPATIKELSDITWQNGNDFEKSMFTNAAKVADYMAQDLAHGFARGDKYETLTKAVCQRFGAVSRRDAYRLVYTEGTHAYNKASSDVFKKYFDQYKISTVGDSKVCDLCRGMAGHVFDFADKEAGVNFPPFHPWCRCSFEVVIPDDWTDRYINAGHTAADAAAVAANMED